MARIRSIKPSFAGDSKVARLSLPARLTFLLLLPECDDDGRMVAAPKRLAGMLYPNDDGITPKQVEKWVAELVREKMVMLYEHDGTRYLVVPKFRVHQSPQHPKPSVLPPPPDVKDSDTAHEGVMTTTGDDHEAVIPDLSGSGRGRGNRSVEPAPPDPGQSILQAFWDASNPKPAQPWPAMLQVVRKMLTAGWPPDDVLWALHDAPAVSTAALTYSLKRRGKPNGNTPAARSEEAMLAWLASEEARA